MTEQQHKAPPYEIIKIDDELELRALCVEDAGRLFDLTDTNREYLAQYLPWVDSTKSTEDSVAFIKQTKEKRLNGEGYGFGIILEGNIVGHMGLMHLKDDKTPEIGYWVAESVSRRGITTRAAQALTEFCFDELNLEKVLIRAREDNVGSNRIAESLGYSFSGVHMEEGGSYNHWLKER
jgi:ribosomal-protein-serine acetyltransferase